MRSCVERSAIDWPRFSFGNSSLLVSAELSPAGFSLHGSVYFVNAKPAGLIRRNGSSISSGCESANVNAAKITRQSKSNLALAFISLGRERRRDITVFYAFCRVIDDVADSSQLSVTEKRLRLEAWREMLRHSVVGEPPLARDVRRLVEKYALSIEM